MPLANPVMRRLRRILIPLIILLLAVVIFMYMSKTRPAAKVIEAVEKTWVVNVEQVKPAVWSPSVTLYGKVEALWSSKLTAGINADVLSVSVREGDKVEKGQTLINLDERDAQLILLQSDAEVAQAEARVESQKVAHEADLATLPREHKLLNLSRDEVKRLQDLTRKKVSSQSALDTARQAVERQAISVSRLRRAINEHEPKTAELQAALARARALQEKATLELARATISAPFNGRIAGVPVAPGRRVRMGDPLIEVIGSEELVFRVLIPERYLPIINRAQQDGHVLGVTAQLDGQQLQGKLLTLTAQVNPGSGGVEALFRIEGDVSLLQNGRLLQLQLSLPARPGLVALPQEAMYGTDQIYLVDEDNRLQLLQVERLGETTLESGDSRVLIRSSQLHDNQSVLITQLPSAVEGLLVKIAGQAD